MKIKFWILLGVILLFNIANVYSLVINSVDTNPEKIAPGETSIIKLNLKNNGETDLKDLNIALDLTQIPFAPHDSASEFSIETLESSKTKSVEFKIIALNSAESGIYKIPVKISYSLDEGTEIKSKESLISITINSIPIISANLENNLLLKLNENEISFKIVNKGLSGVKFLEANIGGSVHYTILSPQDVYIGNIDSNDFDSAEFKIYFKESAPTNINIPLTLKYKDLLNKEYTKEIDISAKIYTKKQAIALGLIKKDNTLIYVIGSAGFLVAWFIYRKWKKKRKMRRIASEKEI